MKGFLSVHSLDKQLTKIKIMKKLLVAVVAAFIFLSACEVEERDGHHYHHPMGWEHRNHPDHHEVYNHGWHHDEHGGEIVVHP
jgi:hypothetical protein